MQNEHDIRNQHKKLHRTPYILSKYFFHQNFIRTLPQHCFSEFRPEVPYG
jgi:hypothetical protein